jgi:hypothetical protein
MTVTRRSKVLGAAFTAVTALGLSAAFSAPAFASETGTAKSAVSASYSESLSSGTVQFNGQPFQLQMAKQFQPVFTPGDPNLRLSDGATLVKGGFRLGGGSETLNVTKGNLTENLKGTLFYTLPHVLTIQVTNFKFETMAGLAHAELVGDVKVTGVAPKPITQAGQDLLNLQVIKGKFSFDGYNINVTDVPGLVSNQVAPLSAGNLMPGTLIADTNFSIPAL